MHGCRVAHESSCHVVEMIDGNEVWRGDVEEFRLSNHLKASIAYAWGYEDENGEIRYIAVLNIPPINSPREAVQAAIASGRFK